MTAQSRRSRQSPGKRDRRTPSKGSVVGVADYRRNEAVPPELAPGEHRCPTCRAAAVLTPSGGSLRAHRDLFGDRCWNKATGEATGIEAPPVVVPPEPTSWHGGPNPNARIYVGSACRDCGKWLPGERSLCGRCYARNA